ncbi:Zn(2)-C6 fungal-type domain-containing protein [Mycena kentingensis (nom. inval.)]|nr:Zn(2)-C6 fungal-type domain-containing protein [Mycena kentingensis (nom. inval.)]
MSSEENDSFDLPSDLPAVPVKKRRIQRACDGCRQKRRACDGLRTATKKCTFCTENGLECIYSGAPTTTKRKSYTEVLEARLAETEKLLRKFTQKDTPPKPEWSPDSTVTQHASLPNARRRGVGVEFASMSIRAVNAPESLGEPGSEAEDDSEHIELARDMASLKLSTHREQFLGKSSGAMLIKQAMALKFSASDPSIAASGPKAIHGASRLPPAWIGQASNSRRMEFWRSMPWKAASPARPAYVFPPSDLLSALVDLYFENTNSHIPLLHRPTFLRLIEEGMHIRDDKFGATLLIVCAIGCRYSDDPRVLDGTLPDGMPQLACGWMYFSQLSKELEHMFDTPGLYDLQRYCLAIQFLEGSATQAAWPLIGIGLRIAEEVGAHRRQTSGNGSSERGPHAHSQPPSSGPGVRVNVKPLPGHTVEAELWRRAFWTLVWYDRMVSCTLGRPCGVQWDDFDIQLPTECDDEYWETSDPAQAFRQPPGTPSKVAFFNSMLKLSNILAFVLQFLYTLEKKATLLRADDPRWEEHIVAELDSALNKWVDDIPEHLRWDPNRADPLFFKQSVALYCAYYHVQMSIHRPFIPMVRRGAKPTVRLDLLGRKQVTYNLQYRCFHLWLSVPTLPDPARMLRMFGFAELEDKPRSSYWQVPSLTTAGVVLLLNVWSTNRTGLAPHMNSTVDEVRKIMTAIKACEDRWQMAGLFFDILNELASIGNVPLQRGMSPLDSDGPLSSNTSGNASPYGPHSDSGSAVSADKLPPCATIFPPQEDASGDGPDALDILQQPYANHDWSTGLGDMAMGLGLGWGAWTDDMYGWLGAPETLAGSSQNTASTAANSGFPQLPMYTAELGRTPAYGPPATTEVAAMFPTDIPVQGQAGGVPAGMWSSPSNESRTGAAALFGFSDPPPLAASELPPFDVSMWANAPPGLGANDWSSYFSMMRGNA